MKIVVGFSIFTNEPSAFGSVMGSIEVAASPAVGDAIWFLNPGNGAQMPSCGFSGVLNVERRSLAANEKDGQLRVSLSDLTVPTTADARAISEYIERGFGLFVDIYGDSE